MPTTTDLGMPYTGFTTRHTRVLPSDPVVSHPGGGWHYTTSPGPSSPCRYAATKFQRRMKSPRRAASEASVRSDVARIVAQNVCSKSTPAVQPALSSRRACLRVFGSALAEDAIRAQPVLRNETTELAVSRTERSVAGVRLRRG
eukprot:6212023-Pleurochrysis_carterae.AAC.1